MIINKSNPEYFEFKQSNVLIVQYCQIIIKIINSKTLQNHVTIFCHLKSIFPFKKRMIRQSSQVSSNKQENFQESHKYSGHINQKISPIFGFQQYGKRHQSKLTKEKQKDLLLKSDKQTMQKCQILLNKIKNKRCVNVLVFSGLAIRYLKVNYDKIKDNIAQSEILQIKECLQQHIQLYNKYLLIRQKTKFIKNSVSKISIAKIEIILTNYKLFKTSSLWLLKFILWKKQKLELFKHFIQTYDQQQKVISEQQMIFKKKFIDSCKILQEIFNLVYIVSQVQRNINSDNSSAVLETDEIENVLTNSIQAIKQSPLMNKYWCDISRCKSQNKNERKQFQILQQNELETSQLSKYSRLLKKLIDYQNDHNDNKLKMINDQAKNQLQNHTAVKKNKQKDDCLQNTTAKKIESAKDEQNTESKDIFISKFDSQSHEQKNEIEKEAFVPSPEVQLLEQQIMQQYIQQNNTEQKHIIGEQNIDQTYLNGNHDFSHYHFLRTNLNNSSMERTQQKDVIDPTLKYLIYSTPQMVKLNVRISQKSIPFIQAFKETFNKKTKNEIKQLKRNNFKDIQQSE